MTNEEIALAALEKCQPKLARKLKEAIQVDGVQPVEVLRAVTTLSHKKGTGTLGWAVIDSAYALGDQS